MSTPLCDCAVASDDLQTFSAILHLIGRRATDWMIDAAAHDQAPTCSACGGSVPTVRFRCRVHFVVLCRHCVAAS
jgi:hypothetical protein